MRAHHMNKFHSVLFRYAVIAALLILVTVSLLMIATPSVIAENPLGRGQDYEVVLVSGEKDPDTGSTIPLEHTVQPGMITHYTFSLWNIGTFPDTYDLSLTGVPDSWSAALSLDKVIIPASTEESLTLSVTPPYQGVSKGQTETITISALSTTDPTNSTASLDSITTLNIKTGFQLNMTMTKDHKETDMQELNNEITLYPGETMAFGVNVQNFANVNDTYYLNVTQNENWDVLFSNYNHHYDLAVPANTLSDEPASLMLQVTAPTDASKGEVNHITVNCFSKFNEDNTVIPNHMSKTIKVTVDYVSYLLVESTLVDMKMDPNETVESTITVKNIGMLDITYETPINTYVDNGGRWYVNYPEAKKDILQPGDIVSFPVQITAPLGAIGGQAQSFTITGLTDDDATFLPVTIQCEVNTIRDLIVTTNPEIVVIPPGRMMEYTMDIVNNGNSNVSVDVMVLSRPTWWTVTLGTSHFYLDPDASTTISVDVECPSSTTIGDYNVELKFQDARDGTDILTYDTVVTVDDYPDLTIEGTDINVSNLNPKDKETVTIDLTVYNKGTLDASNIVVKVVQVTAAGSRPLIHEETIASLPAGESYSISINWQAVVSADKIEVEIDPESAIEESNEQNNVAWVALHVPNPSSTTPSTGEGRAMGVKEVAAIITATALVTLASCLILLKVGGKELTSVLGVGSGLFAPLYSKLRHDDVLNNEIREDIYDFILENPGSHFRSILTELALSNGTLSHHLNTLEREDFIKSERDGSLRRYYPKGRRLVGEVYDLNDVQKKIMGVVAKNPGISQKEVATAVEVSQPTAHYHLTALRNARLIELRREGKRQKCFIVRRVS